jgi:hypothetical protein
MPFAADGQISQSPIDGGVEITIEQYRAALSGMMAGQEVLIEEGELLIREPAPSPEHTWENGEWVAPPTPEPELEPEPEPPTLEDLIAAKLAELDDYRWQMEVGGAAFGGGMIRTDWNSQNKIAAAYIMAINDPDYTIPVWEVVPGTFMELDNATIRALGITVRDHVQATFNRKAELHPVIAALDSVGAVEGFDVAAEWYRTD